MAPEQLLIERYTHSVDVFAFGVLLASMQVRRGNPYGRNADRRSGPLGAFDSRSP